MMNKNDMLLSKIVKYCNEVEGTVQRFGMDRNLYESDYVFSNACNMCILQIGEIVANITDDFKQAYR